MTANEQPQISLCMIVKDEEQYLERCLDSAEGAYDELVIVDTGSTDRTKEIATQYGARIFDFPWCDDFSAARNRGLEEARGEWILVLDADEQLSEGSVEEIRKRVEETDKAAFVFVLHDLREGDSIILRLFRNTPELRYSYRVHESIGIDEYVAATGLKCTLSQARVDHDGALSTVFTARKKEERYRRIFAKQLEETPDDPYIVYKWAMMLYFMRDPQCAQWFEKSAELCVSHPRGDVLVWMSDAVGAHLSQLMEKSKWDEIGKWLERIEGRWKNVPLIEYLRGRYRLAMGLRSFEAALSHFDMVRQYHEKPVNVIVSHYLTGYAAELGRSAALQGMGRLAEAKVSVELAAALEKLDPLREVPT